MKRYLFVSGCPRSGTTALTTILNWAPRCFIGQERFNMLFNRDDTKFTPDLFESARLRSFQKFDCGYDSFDKMKAYNQATANPAAVENIESAEVVGDKLISLWRNFSVFDRPAWEGKTVHVLHIIRDVFDVAASYQTRFQNEADKWQADFLKGVEVWSRSVARVSDWYASAGDTPRSRVHVITYDGLFDTDETEFIGKCRTIFDIAGLDFGDEQRLGLAKVYAGSQKARERRAVYPEIRQKVEEAVAEDILKKYASLRDRALV